MKKKDPLDPFLRLLHVIESLPGGTKDREEAPLRAYMPGLWPTVGDLVKLIRSSGTD